MTVPARSILILGFSFLSGLFSQLYDRAPLNPIADHQPIPVRSESGDVLDINLELPSFLEFRDQLLTDEPKTITGVYVPGMLALRVVYQPLGQPNYVSAAPGTTTLFSSAKKRGTLGFLAHNYSSGSEFFDLRPDQIVIVLFGDGSYERYRILNSEQYQALNPHSPYSSFLALDASERTFSSEDLFFRFYGGDPPLVFQTCIEQDSELSWGRHFVIAVKYREHPTTICALKKVTGTGECSINSSSRELSVDLVAK